MTEKPDSSDVAPGSQPSSPAGKWSRRLKRLSIIALVALVLLAVLGLGAEYYTSRPQFCGSCHIMEPYYKGWEKDIHSDKADAACVDCHYAPGQQHTLKAKFRGMSQLMSYFSGRAGRARPKAHVDDTSCLSSKCHGDQKFMTEEIKLGNVTFTHKKHLDPDSEMLVEKQRQLAELGQKLSDRLGSENLAAIRKLAQSVKHADEINWQITEWLAAHTLLPHREDALAFAELLHAEVRIDQLNGLKCASCHQFEPTIKDHFSVNKTTCFTCHFANQPFNTYTGKCLNCHEPPSVAVPVHATLRPDATKQTAGTRPEVTMNHELIVKNNVNCASCHADLVQGTGQVNRSDCEDCHDQEYYLKDFNKLTTEVVREYHRIHAAGQHARCNDCHSLIQHQLTPTAETSDMVALLKPVRQDCQHCHPNHHREQIELLLGQGGFVSHTEAGIPSQMMGSRVNCRGCHNKGGADAKGEAVITGTAESCRSCHDEEYIQLFARWQRSIEARLTESQELLAKVEQRLAAVSTQPDRDLSEANQLLTRAGHNIRLVYTANGIHNKNYALMLLDQAVLYLEQAIKLLPG